MPPVGAGLVGCPKMLRVLPNPGVVCWPKGALDEKSVPPNPGLDAACCCCCGCPKILVCCPNPPCAPACCCPNPGVELAKRLGEEPICWAGAAVLPKLKGEEPNCGWPKGAGVLEGPKGDGELALAKGCEPNPPKPLLVLLPKAEVL